MSIITNADTYLNTSVMDSGSVMNSSVMDSGSRIGLASGVINTIQYRYVVMDKIFKYSWYRSDLLIILSLIDTFGYVYYDNVVKQDVYIPDDIKKYIESNRLIYTRNEKLSKIL